MKPFVRSMAWSGVLCVGLLVACKREHEPGEKEAKTEPTPETKTEAAQPMPETAANVTPSEAAQGEAAQPGAVVVEQLIAPTVTGKLAKDLVDEGRGVATALDAAVTAISNNDVATAKTEVAKAQTELDKLAAEQPTVDVAVEMWRKNNELDIAEAQADVDTVPLLATLTRVDVPVFNRQEIAARHAERSKTKPNETTATQKASDLGVIDSNLVYMEVDLPIAATKIAVADAKRQLDEGKVDVAKQTLQDAIGSFDVIEVVSEAPEYQARLLVWAAENAFVQGNLVESARLLGDASNMLEPLEKNETDPQGRMMVTTLLAEMKPLQQALTAGNPEQATGFARLERNVLSYTRRSALHSMMARRHQAQQQAIADSLMWLEKAQTEGVSKTESNTAATADLIRAESVLVQASNVAPASAQPNLADLHNRIQHVIELDRAATRDPQAIEDELRDVIFDLRMLMMEIGTSAVESQKGPA